MPPVNWPLPHAPCNKPPSTKPPAMPPVNWPISPPMPTCAHWPPCNKPPPDAPSQLATSTCPLPNAHFPLSRIPSATPNAPTKVPSASPLASMVSEPTGQQSCRSDAGARPVIQLPPPSARRCRIN
ncbi:hypothetical protein N7449_000001 [Penicillium cf. viridicatum]|uniref:Uncharacterized protein n=1 Tax=Penicillium cf. viridicatum TaxID=2972119 RepID=A0A9W9N416_9EURO|nr:hypothetical protein N7449_000001 [Penicillium cf. viridicatum]